jgi:hypothetical protein
VRALIVQPDGEPLAIERVHPVEMLRDGARLVRLELSGEVPRESVRGELLELRQRLLQVVFAKIPLARLRHDLQGLRGLQLADCDEPHGLRLASVSHCSGCDALPCFSEPVQ